MERDTPELVQATRLPQTRLRRFQPHARGPAEAAKADVRPITQQVAGESGHAADLPDNLPSSLGIEGCVGLADPHLAGTLRASVRDLPAPAADVGTSRRHIEEQEWERRRAVIEQQRAEAQAEREAKRRAQHVACATAARDAAAVTAMRQQRTREEVRHWLAGLLPKHMTARTALAALSFTVAAGEAGLRSSMRRARAFYHPDSACRRGLSESELIKSEEIFKVLGSLSRGD
jgi:hypothetical protein